MASGKIEFLYRVIHEECHSFRELICHVRLMKKVHINMGPISIVSEKTMYVFRNGMKPCEPHSVDVREISEPSADSGESPFELAISRLCLWIVLWVADWAISRELGYSRVLLATDFNSWRFAKFWATTRNFDERILGEQQIVSLLLFSQIFINCYNSYIRYGS